MSSTFRRWRTTFCKRRARWSKVVTTCARWPHNSVRRCSVTRCRESKPNKDKSMTRRTIELPDTFHLHFDYRVVYSDINASSHLAADRIMPITIEAQFRFIKSLGYSDATVFEDAGLIMVHSETQYISESHHDDELRVSM